MAGKLKKVFFVSIIGVGSLFVVTGILYVNAPSPQNSTSGTQETGTFGNLQEDSLAGTQYDAADVVDFEKRSAERLESLKARGKELDELYSGSDLSTINQTIGEEESALVEENFGTLSNFDRPAPSNTAPAPPEALEDADTVDAEAEAPSVPDESTFLPQAQAEVPEQDAYTVPEPANDPIAETEVSTASQAATEKEENALLEALTENLEQVPTRQTIRAMIESSLEPVTTSARATQAQLDRTLARLDAIEANKANAMQPEAGADDEKVFELLEQVADLSDRLGRLEAANQPAAPASASQPASKPATPNVTGLYKALAIEDGKAVLEGQNTGRLYRLGIGDALAYGGALEAITGDTIILKWPHRTVMLSIF